LKAVNTQKDTDKYGLMIYTLNKIDNKIMKKIKKTTEDRLKS